MGFLIGLACFAFTIYAVVEGALYGSHGDYLQGIYWMTWAIVLIQVEILVAVSTWNNKKAGK